MVNFENQFNELINKCIENMPEYLMYYFDYEMKYNDREDYRNNIENLNFSSSNPKLMTYHSAKGLQFETVFIPLGWYGRSQASRKKALYVAMTRTYRDLYITYSGQLPNMISRIPTNLYKTTEIEEVEDI